MKGLNRKIMCLILSLSILTMTGCGGREANPIRTRQLGDEQKSCDALRTEMYYIQNEISRLLPKSDKTGKNVALGVAGAFLIIPWFFMDLKEGEKKEVEAYRKRYNQLLMISQQRDCKLPPLITKETADTAKGESADTETKTLSQEEYKEYQRYIERKKK